MNYDSKQIRKQQKEVMVKTPAVDKMRGRRRRNSFGDLPLPDDLSDVQLSASQPGTSSDGFTTSNQFEMLSDYDISGDEENVNNGGGDGTAAAAGDTGDGAAGGNIVNKAVPAATKIRCPPIFVYGSSVLALNRLFSTIPLGIDDYHLRVNKGCIQIRVSTKPFFSEIVRILKDSDVRFYTHGTSDETPVKIVLSGLPVFPEEEIRRELSNEFVYPKSVRQLGKSKYGDYALYLLQFDKGTVKLQKLKEIKALFNVIVRWRHYSKKKSDVIQCFRCQQYGHGMRDCHLDAKCVKCGERHQTTECEIPARADAVVNEDRSQIRCANCSQNHTANYKGCPTRLKYLQDLKAKKKTKPTPNAPKVSQAPVPTPNGPSGDLSQLLGSLTSQGTSYSQALKGNGQADASNLFSIEEFICLAKELFTRLASCQSKAMQFLALSELIINSLKVVNWNCRSIRNKVVEFSHFLQAHEIDIAAVTETWLQLNNSVYFQNYTVVRADRDSPDATRGGGVALLVRNGLDYSKLESSTRAIESVGVSVKANPSPVNIFAVYYPGSTCRATLCQLRRDIHQLTNIDGPFFLVGDLNARHRMWNCTRANKAGKILQQEYESNDFYIHAPDTPTRIPAGRGRPSTIDLVISNNTVQMSKPLTHTELSSDHLPVTFTIEADVPVTPAGRLIRCFNQADWRIFARKIDQTVDLTANWINDLDLPEKIDNAIAQITEIVKSAEEAAVPKRRIFPKKEDIPDELKLLIRLRNVRRRQFIRRRDPLLGAVVSHLNNVISMKSATHRYKNFGLMLMNLDNGGNKFWNLTRNLRNTVKYSPPLNVNGNLLASPRQKAEALAAAFADAHNNEEPGDPETTVVVENVLDHIRAGNYPVPHSALVKPKEVKLIIHKLKNRKSPGQDGILNTCLKHLPRKAMVVLTKIFNACLALGYFPVGWKHANVIAISKANKDITNPSNYRPISLLSSLSKVLERIILSRINCHLQTAEVIPHEQFGFKPGHSTVHQLVRITQKVKRGFLTGSSTGMVLLDVEKAYDSVWQDAVVYKLFRSNLQPYLVKIVESFLSNRSFAVTVNGQSSSVHNIPFGVPQGSVLSPTLYNILTSDVPMVDGVSYAFFADDTAFLASDKDPQIVVTHLQAAQNNLEEFQRNWRIKLNAEKTQSIFFTRRRAARHLPRRSINVNGQPTTWDDEVKYLGVVLDRKLKYDKHVNYIAGKVDRSTKALYSLLNRRSKLHIKNKSLVIKCIIRPMMTYASAVWGNCAKTHRKRLQVKQNKLLKMVYNLDPWYPTNDLHKLAGIDTIDESIERATSTLRTSCGMSTNPLIEALHRQL